MRKILCAIDETEVSRKAEAFAADFSRATDAELRFLHVNPVTIEDLTSPGAMDVTVLEEVEAKEHEVMHHAEGLAREYNLPDAQCITIQSHKIADANVKYAEAEGYDHIITGSTGRTGIPRLLLGSVAGDIIHKAHCPVTVVR